MTAAVNLNWQNMDLQKHNHRCNSWLISFAAAQAGVCKAAMQCNAAGLSGCERQTNNW